MAVLLCGCLTLAGVANGFASTTATPASQPAPEAVQQSRDQLRELVAPIALYPDPLIGQILAAATYPSQLLKADDWMQQHQGLTGDALAKEVDKQPWDPSVKALTAFPAVLGNMSQNLAWTAELGDAYVNQGQELTQTIQDMRILAKNAGNLTPTTQENVTTDGDTILNPHRPMKSTFLNMIPGMCMGTYCLFSLVGIRIPDFIFMARESRLDWGSGLGGMAAMAGGGITGDAIGIMARWCTIIMRSSPIIDRS
jgi:hypothetical protein